MCSRQQASVAGGRGQARVEHQHALVRDLNRQARDDDRKEHPVARVRDEGQRGVERDEPGQQPAWGRRRTNDVIDDRLERPR
jgi:hypothetical protein